MFCLREIEFLSLCMHSVQKWEMCSIYVMTCSLMIRYVDFMLIWKYKCLGLENKFLKVNLE